MLECKLYRIREDGVILVQTTSTENKKVLQVETGLEMIDPIDVGDRYFDKVAFEVKYRPLKYTYIETDKEIEKE